MGDWNEEERDFALLLWPVKARYILAAKQRASKKEAYFYDKSRHHQAVSDAFRHQMYEEVKSTYGGRYVRYEGKLYRVPAKDSKMWNFYNYDDMYKIDWVKREILVRLELLRLDGKSYAKLKYLWPLISISKLKVVEAPDVAVNGLALEETTELAV